VLSRLNNLWQEIRTLRPTVAPASYMPTIPDQDSEETLVEEAEAAPSWEAQSISGRNIIIIYSDSKGQGSERQVICRKLDVKGGVVYLTALCLLRERVRTFRTDRVSSVIDPVSGEIFEPGKDYFLDFDHDSKSASRFDYGLSVTQFAALNSALNVLAFMARCDGEWHELEADAIEDFVTAFWMREEVRADLDLDAVSKHAARLAPDAETFWTSLMACQRHPVLSSILRRHIANVIDADGHHHPVELYWARQIDDFLAEPA
jgi:hypothetical protein